MNRQYLSVKKYNENLFKTPLNNIIQGDFDPKLSKIENLMQHHFKITAHATRVLNTIGPNAKSLFYKITCKVIGSIIVLHFRYLNYAKNLE